MSQALTTTGDESSDSTTLSDGTTLEVGTRFQIFDKYTRTDDNGNTVERETRVDTYEVVELTTYREDGVLHGQVIAQSQNHALPNEYNVTALDQMFSDVLEGGMAGEEWQSFAGLCSERNYE